MKTVYFILGMHRSGTSALGGVLDLMGLEFGSDLMKADEGNPKGYFENNFVYRLNKKILEENNSSWSDYNFSFDKIDKLKIPIYIDQAKKIIDKEFKYSENFVIKDPRICLLFPIWESACLSLDINIKIILPYRNPLEVANSLKKRNDFSFEKSLIIWLHHFFSAELYSRKYERVFLFFNELLDETESSIKILSDFTNLNNNEKINKEINKFLDKNIKYNNISLENFTKEVPFFLRNLIKFLNKKEFDKLNQLDSSRKDFYYSLELFQHEEIYNSLKGLRELRNEYKIVLEDKQKYKELKDTLYEQCNVLKVDHKKLKEKIQTLELTLNTEQSDHEKLKEKIQTLELALNTEQSDHEKLKEKIQTLELTLNNEQSDHEKLKEKIQTLELTLNNEQRNHEKSKESIHELKLLLKKIDKEVVNYQNENTILVDKISKKHQSQLLEKNSFEKQLMNIKVTIIKLVDEYKIVCEKDLNTEKMLKQRGINNLEQFYTLFIKHTGIETRLKFINNLKIKRIIKSFKGKTEEKFKIIENKFNRIPFKFIESFDQEAYLDLNKEVKKAVNDGRFESALEHFIFFGFDEVLRGDRTLNISVPFYNKKSIHRTNKDIEYDFFKYLENSMATPNIAFRELDLGIIKELNSLTYSKDSDILLPVNKAILPKKRTIDIILPIYNALDDVKNCINSLYKYKTFDFNLIAIDDCSDIETKVYLEKESVQKGFKLLRNKENLRFTKTVNRGFLESKADFVVLLNSDTIVTPKWIEKILACFDSNEKIGIVGPLSNAASWQTVPVRDDKELGGWLVNEIPNRYSIEEMGLLVETLSKKIYPKVPSVNGFCYVIKREVLDINGFLDEEYFPTGYGEEDDFSIRTRDAGFEIAVADDTYIFHAKSKSYTHEVRAVLTQGGRKSLDKKHGEKRIKKLINDWKSEPLLPKIAKHIESYMQISTKNKKVVYTAIFGNYDSIKEPEYINKDWDYICFTNNKNLKSKTFKIKYVDAIFENQTKNARMIKILSHIFLIDYDYSLWIDGNVKLRGNNIEELIKNNKIDEYISLHKHVKRECVYDELKACIDAKKDNSKIMLKQLDNYKKEGMPKKIGLVETAEILRQENNKKTKALNLLWWKELNENSIRDQLSFNYVCWKNNFHYSIMKGIQWLDPYFNIYKHGTKISVRTNPEVTIIIVIKKETALTIETMIKNITSITQYSKYKIILANTIENLEIDRTLNRLKELYPLVDIIGNSKGRSVLDAKNYIAGKVTSPYICFIDASSKVIEGNWLELLVNELTLNNCTVMAGPTILDKEYNFLSASISIKQKNNIFVEARHRSLIGGTGNVYAISDKCMLVEKEAFIKVNKFSNKFDSQEEASIDLSFKFLELNLNTKFVLNSQIIDLSTKFSEKNKIIDSKQLKTIWKKSNILGKNIDALKCKKKNKLFIIPQYQRNGTFTATGYIRIIYPYMVLKNNYHIQVCKDIKDVIASTPEYLIIQRYSISIENFKEIKSKVKGIKIIYDIDDDLIYHFKDDYSKVKTIKYLLIHSDIVTVSTNNLLLEYKQYNSNIKKIDNVLNADIWKSSINNIKNFNKINILYMGSKSHYNDFLLIKDDLIQLKKYYGEKISIDIIGIMSDNLQSSKEYFNYIIPPEEARTSYDEFSKWISKENRWHIGIAPLEDNIFNNKKSYIKFLDYSALGLLTIASKVVPYTDIIENGINGVLVDQRESWFDTISSFIENIEKIKKISTIAKQQFTQKHTIKNSESLKVLFNA